MAVGDKPHVVCIPYPAQSHMKAMLKLAKLLHHKGCHITFVNTEYNHRRLLKARGPNSLDGLPDFRFETIPDGLPPSDANATQHIPSLCESIRKNALAPFLSLVSKINDGCASPPDVPPVTCIVSDGFMSFTITAGEQLGVPVMLFFTMSACGVMGFYQLHVLLEKGLTPLKDVSYITNGYLDTVTKLAQAKRLLTVELHSAHVAEIMGQVSKAETVCSCCWEHGTGVQSRMWQLSAVISRQFHISVFWQILAKPAQP